jgi:hypothetical protein
MKTPSVSLTKRMAKSLAGHALAFLTAVAIASIALTWVTLGVAAYYVPLPLPQSPVRILVVDPTPADRAEDAR